MADFKPSDVGQIFGQEHLLDLLCNWSEDLAQIPRALLLSGPYGCGKTSIAKILAGKLTTNERDLICIDSGQTRGIDDIRGLVDSARFSPVGPAKVYILDEMHRLTKDAQSALLIALEEPPPRTYFFLCTTEPHGLLPTILSRCTKLHFKLLTEEATCQMLGFATGNKLSREVMVSIHNMSSGHARDAVKYASLVTASGAQVLNAQNLYTQLGDIRVLARDWIQSVLSNPQTLSQMPIATLLSDEQTLSIVLDESVDAACTRFIGSAAYPELLKMRALKRLYQVTPKEQFLHFVAVMSAYIK